MSKEDNMIWAFFSIVCAVNIIILAWHAATHRCTPSSKFLDWFDVDVPIPYEPVDPHDPPTDFDG
jgi:hypothetical protein